VTADAFQRFEVWFGCLFLGLGVLALLISGVVYAAVARSARYWPMRWAFLGAPIGIGLIFSLLGAGTAGFGLWQADTERRILATGTTVRASVTEVGQTYTRVNGRYLWRVHYQYADGSGMSHRGASGLLDSREAQTWRPGDQVFVRYDPAQPSMSVWIGHEDLAARHRPRFGNIRVAASGHGPA
jgi:hypothetical protein